MKERSRGPQRTVLRSYPSSDDRPWLYVLLETLAELSALDAEESVAAVAARRARELFGASVRAVILLTENESLRIVRSEDAAGLPEHISPSPASLTTYVAGRIAEIEDLDASDDAHPDLAPLGRAGFKHVLTAAFGPSNAVTGFLAVLHERDTTYSDDELTLLAIFATAVGLRLGAIERERMR